MLAQASAKPYIKYGDTKKSFIAIIAPSGLTVPKKTAVNSCEDAKNDLTWKAERIDAKDGEVVMKIRLTGKGHGKHGAPDTGSLSITLSDPPSGCSATVQRLDVQYVDDIS